MPVPSISSKPVVRRARKPMAAPVSPIPASSGVCHSCNALPAGSMEVAALLLVLVFSLSAVLLTSIYATHMQAGKVADLEAQISELQR